MQQQGLWGFLGQDLLGVVVKLPSISSGVKVRNKQGLGNCVFMALPGCRLWKCAALLGSWTASRQGVEAWINV